MVDLASLRAGGSRMIRPLILFDQRKEIIHSPTVLFEGTIHDPFSFPGVTVYLDAYCCPPNRISMPNWPIYGQSFKGSTMSYNILGRPLESRDRRKGEVFWPPIPYGVPPEFLRSRANPHWITRVFPGRKFGARNPQSRQVINGVRA